MIHFNQNSLLHLTNLKNLILRRNQKVTNECLSALTHLTQLDIRWNDTIGDLSIMTLTKLTTLEAGDGNRMKV